jgi:hypothetical protein
MQHLAIPIDLKHNHHRMITVLIISGDIHVALNPGPPKEFWSFRHLVKSEPRLVISAPS